MAKRIEPKLAKGMRDILGPPIRRREAMLDRIREVIERYGYQPLETPAIEFAEVLTGAKAGEAGQRIYTWEHEEDPMPTMPAKRATTTHGR